MATGLYRSIVTEFVYNEPVVVLLFIMMSITNLSTKHHLAEKMAKTVMASNLFASGCIENPEHRNNPDQLEQTNFCECDHVQATESLICSLLWAVKGKVVPRL